MDFELSAEQKLIQSQIREVCSDFGPEYWREKDANHEFPSEFYQALADDGWFGLTVPEEYGGQGYGIEEGIIVQREITRSGSGQAGSSITATQTYNAEPLVRFGSETMKEEYLPKIASGEAHLAVGVTEPNAGHDTSRIEVFAERNGNEYLVNGQKIWTSRAQDADLMLLIARTTPKEECDGRFDGLSLFLAEFDKDLDTVEVAEIPKAGRHAADSNEVWYKDFSIPVENRIGEEGKGFKYLLTFANSERLLVSAAAIGIGLAAIDKASDYARERVVFDQPIGSYQSIQHPLAESWCRLQSAESLVQKAAWKYDNDMDCGGEANAAKMLASEAALEAAERAVRVHGGMGYSEEYDVARYWREAALLVLTPVSNEMVKNYIGQHELDLPRSY